MASFISPRLILASRFVLLLMCALLLAQAFVSTAFAENSNDENNAQVIQQFVEKNPVENEKLAIQDKDKRLIMFLLGVPLLVFIVITGVLGVAMVVYGKQVFVPHMIFAGLSITLAIAHAVVGLVWFYPF